MSSPEQTPAAPEAPARPTTAKGREEKSRAYALRTRNQPALKALGWSVWGRDRPEGACRRKDCAGKTTHPRQEWCKSCRVILSRAQWATFHNKGFGGPRSPIREGKPTRLAALRPNEAKAMLKKRGKLTPELAARIDQAAADLRKIRERVKRGRHLLALARKPLTDRKWSKG